MRKRNLASLAAPSFLAAAALMGTLVPMPLFAKNDAGYDTNTTAPDNSATNKGDQAAQAPTSDHAGNQLSDRDAMQKIRQSVMADKSLSTYAQNVKIISQNGKVTLKGPVKSDQEKQNIEAKATSVVGSGNVVDELSVNTAN